MVGEDPRRGLEEHLLATSVEGVVTGERRKSEGSVKALRFSGLDGLRAIAVSVVVLVHFWPDLLPGGFTGVDVFFVVSGFLITSLLISERDHYGKVSLWGFWKRRARRLLPAMALTVCVVLALAIPIGGDLLYKIKEQIITIALSVYNWLLILQGPDYFSATVTPLFKPFWSLALEGQFYLVWPLIFILLAKRLRYRLGMCLSAIGIVISAGLMWLSFDPVASGRSYYGTDTHIFPILVGIFLAFSLRVLTQKTRWEPAFSPLTVRIISTLALISLPVTFVLAANELAFVLPFGLLLVAAATSILIVVSQWPGNVVSPILDSTPMVWVGRRSYGIYLWHWPLLIIFEEVWGRSLPEGTVPVITVAVSLVCAALSYRLVEKPIRAAGLMTYLRQAVARRNSGASRAGAAILSVTVLALPIVAGCAIVSAPEKTQLETSISPSSQPDSPNDTPGTSSAPVPTPKPSSQSNNTIPAGDEMVVFGDSVTLASKVQLEKAFPGIVVDAAVSRQLIDAPKLINKYLQAHKPRPKFIIIALGTNGVGSKADLDQAITAAGEATVVLVTAHANRAWIPGVNDMLRNAASSPRALVADWDKAIQGKAGLLAKDGIHPGPEGGRLYAETIKNAIKTGKP